MSNNAAGRSRDERSGDERSDYRSIFGDLREHVRAYVSKQLLLPRQEIKEIVGRNLRALAWIAVGMLFLFLFLIAIVVAKIALLALFMPLWLAALAVALFWLVLAFLLVFIGMRKFHLKGPERTIRSVKETISWVKATLLGRSAS